VRPAQAAADRTPAARVRVKTGTPTTAERERAAPGDDPRKATRKSRKRRNRANDRSAGTGSRGAERRSDRGTERSAAAPGQTKLAKGPATGRAVGRPPTAGAPRENPGRSVRRRPNAVAPSKPPAPVKPAPGRTTAPGSRRSERAAPKPVKTPPPLPAADTAVPNGNAKANR
jgi:hypothetical protein